MASFHVCRRDSEECRDCGFCTEHFVCPGVGKPKDYPLERYFRDARAFTIYPLTEEIYRTVLGRMLLKLPLPWKGLPTMGPPAPGKRPPT